MYGLRGMLEENDYSNTEMVFPFMAAFLDRVLLNRENHCLTNTHTLYSDTLNQHMYSSCDGERAEFSTVNLRKGTL